MPVPALYDFQAEAVERLRQNIRRGLRRQILGAPTGSGKTVVAAHLIEAAAAKGLRAMFVVDMVTLVEQTSRTFSRFGIRHGVMQGGNSVGWHEAVQVCSAQTLEARQLWMDVHLLVVDECHSQRKWIQAKMVESGVCTIGLTATPITDGLGDVYQDVVTVRTTNQLIESKHLARLVVYDGKSADMSGAKRTGGEWRASEVRERGRVILGDIVREWTEKTQKHFGGPAKTIVFSADVEHGAEIVKQFAEAGHVFRQISYKDRDNERRQRLIRRFENGDVTGLVSCEALAKGFDVPATRVLVDARNYRRALAPVIQKYGRVMRSHPGKDYGLLLDHSGNYLRFFGRLQEFYQNGVRKLPVRADKKKRVVVTDDTEHHAEQRCACGCVLPPGADHCPACGRQKRRRRTTVTIRNARLTKTVGVGGKIGGGVPAVGKREQWIWDQCCAGAVKRHPGGDLLRFANGYYKGVTGHWMVPGMPFSASAAAGRTRVDPGFDAALTERLRAYARQKKQGGNGRYGRLL